MHCSTFKALVVLIGTTSSTFCFGPDRSADADVIVQWVNEEFYSFDVTHVPDLDQRRSALPDGGVYYCVPTSGVNWAGYMANHGLPQLPPGPGYWANPYLYDLATQNIHIMGLAMLTDLYGTTKPEWRQRGLQAWFNQTGGHFVVTTFLHDTDWSPKVESINTAVMSGMFIIPSIGWYFELPDSYIRRDGGHAVCVNYGARYQDYYRMGIRDPGSDEGDNTIQSPFTTELYDVEHTFARHVDYGETRMVSRFPAYGGGGKVGYLDGYSAICPFFVLTTHDTEPGVFQIQFATQLFGMAVPSFREWFAPELVPVRSLVIHPDLTGYLYIAESEPARVYQLDPVTGMSEMIELPFDDPREIVISRLRDLYVLDGDELVRMAIDVKPPRDDGRVTPPHALCAMAYENETDELVLLSADNQTVVRYPHHLDSDPLVKFIVPQIPLSENASICWDATRDAVWVLSDASSSLFMLTEAGPYSLQSREFTHALLTAPLDIDLNDNGRIFVSNAGEILEFELTERGLELAAEPFFAGVAAGAHLCVAKSSTNYQEDLHGGEEWYDVLPELYAEPTESCDADVNYDGAVDVLDLLDILAAWGPCEDGHFCSEDITHDSEVNVLDLLQLLADWGPCQPLGACCFWDGTCTDRPQEACMLQGNSSWFEGERCATFSCSALPTGACCLDGACVATNTEFQCADLGGVWFEDEDCANYNCPTTYCDAWGACGQHISRVRVGDIDNVSGCPSGYSDYTSLSAEVCIGYTRHLFITTADPQAYDVCGVWIDWNQNLVFDYPDELANSADMAAGAWLTYIGAPLDAKPGPTRMRICLVNEDFPFPCGPLGPGEVEDYTIVVIE
jgi:hypothetical protein